MAFQGVRVNGHKGVFEQPIKFGMSDTGPYSVRTFHGTRTDILAFLPSLQLSGATYEIRDTFSGTRVELEIKFSTAPGGGSEVPVDNWEYFAGEVEKDLLDSGLSGIETITDADKKLIRELVLDPSLGFTFANVNSDSAYRLILAGVKSARILTPAVRHTATVSNTYTVPASLAHVGQIISTNALAALENFPSGLLFVLPNPIDPTPLDNTASYPTRKYGWYKKHPTVRIAANQKIQIEQEWEFGLWSTFIYGAPLT